MIHETEANRKVAIPVLARLASCLRSDIDEVESAEDHQNATGAPKNICPTGAFGPIQIALNEVGGCAGHDNHGAVPQAITGSARRSILSHSTVPI